LNPADLAWLSLGVQSRVQLREVPIEPTECHDQQRGGGNVDGVKRMWDMARPEHESPGLGMESFVAASDVERTGEHLPAFVFTAMGVTRRATVDRDLNDRDIEIGF
jgi:hypothetical protein